jgi:hypothetical protein
MRKVFLNHRGRIAFVGPAAIVFVSPASAQGNPERNAYSIHDRKFSEHERDLP